MGQLQQLPNIGQEMERQLHAIGIETAEQLRQMGSKQAWLAIQAIDPSACYNRLCGLEGAVQNVRYHHLPDEVKQDLKAFYLAHKLQ
ncbi:TfoX/Sxy family protein [Eubacteriales bacterium OttesenSCG-928-N14]|nr:TfoX/Sxy family protein [Eubacteriales bacterium OttesenSCG-928-N14]